MHIASDKGFKYHRRKPVGDLGLGEVYPFRLDFEETALNKLSAEKGRVFMIRHGESTLNAAESASSVKGADCPAWWQERHRDAGLTELGFQQCKDAKFLLPHLKMIVISP